MGRWEVKTQPTAEPVTLTEAKAQLNVPDNISDWDGLIEGKIKAARIYVEEYIGQWLVTQTITAYFDEFPCDWLELPRGPLTSITHIKYTDDGTQKVWDANEYITDKVSKMPRISPKAGQSWPTNDDTINSIEVEFVAGYGGASDVPQNFKEAILVLAAHYFEHREDTVHTLPTRVVDSLFRHANHMF